MPLMFSLKEHTYFFILKTFIEVVIYQIFIVDSSSPSSRLVSSQLSSSDLLLPSLCCHRHFCNVCQFLEIIF